MHLKSAHIEHACRTMLLVLDEKSLCLLNRCDHHVVGRRNVVLGRLHAWRQETYTRVMNVRASVQRV